MAVTLWVVKGKGVAFEATVDMENNWTVNLNDPSTAISEAHSLAFDAEEGTHADYQPDPANQYAYAILKLYPQSEILGGLYPVDPEDQVHDPLRRAY